MRIMKRRRKAMNTNVMKIAKLGVSIASVVVTVASSYFANKELDEKIAKKVAEELAKQSAQ